MSIGRVCLLPPVLMAFPFLPAAAQEPVKPQLTATIITATKQATLFTGLERQMLAMVQKKDKAGLESMLVDDSAIEMPDADSQAGEDWVDYVTSKDFSLRSFIVKQVSVADLGNSAVVKYVRVQQAWWKGKNVSGEFFVVDLWTKSGDSWKLASRYVAKVGSVPLKIHAKPSGKE